MASANDERKNIPQLALAKQFSHTIKSFPILALAKTLTMSFVKIWVHLVFSTKNREPLLTKDIRPTVHQHIMENCKKKDIFLQAINGYTEHLHCLISLGKSQNIAEIAQLIKGESSFWINRNKICKSKFTWQDDYFAVSVSESQVKTVTAYINNQEEHHSKKSFAEEVNEFMKKYGFSIIKGT